ncbi:transcription elongation factor GreA [Ruminiclostridium sufflavum DSM 19573]|uniref:Transcription elongation factor GreA n=1 Tax=Ruminiclostridium sufflavum DSM 19573 TaxID=1121337 RepID=A0A318Y7F8_9FIRM|nr:transcription elongation factor GreA [Ruminiclostridium sufflavum]PYG88124.1 transcription elongation factor GreA [Ruminiclostridium sufflavum DSM 19573]
MSAKEVVLTYEGLKKLEEELEFLRGTKRKEVAERIKQALSFGDISENSEYDEAKNEQAQMEGRIIQLESMLKHARVIDEDDVNTDAVSLGSKVKIYDMEFDEEVVYHIVGSTEANPLKSKISNESPVGAALMGHKKDDIVEVQVPDGTMRFKILEISK